MSCRSPDLPGSLGEDYAQLGDTGFVARYHAACRCQAVRYEVGADPVDAKLCHCLDCQTLHGAPMQWAAIFHKGDVRLIAGLESIEFYSVGAAREERILPCKLRWSG